VYGPGQPTTETQTTQPKQQWRQQRVLDDLEAIAYQLSVHAALVAAAIKQRDDLILLQGPSAEDSEEEGDESCIFMFIPQALTPISSGLSSPSPIASADLEKISLLNKLMTLNIHVTAQTNLRTIKLRNARHPCLQPQNEITALRISCVHPQFSMTAVEDLLRPSRPRDGAPWRRDI
jgi:hypothetical protein